MREPLHAVRIAQITGGKLLGSRDALVTGGRADSRICQEGDLYVALPGEQTDGSLFVSQAWEAGASVALADQTKEYPSPPEGKALVLVPHPLSALQTLARAMREEQDGLQVVGITGSNGKTTTKEILRSILQEWKGSAVLASEGNYNSDVGLPLTLLRLQPEHEIAVLEMGMNRIGEMGELASVAHPNVAVVTNVGTAHIGMLGSREAVAVEKRSIFDYASPDTIAVVEGDGEWRDFLLENFPGSVRFFGEWGLSGWESSNDLGLRGHVIRRNGVEVPFALPGFHNLKNAMAAVEAALALGAPEEAVLKGLETVRPESGRSQVIDGTVTVIRDCYNANPESLQAAFQLFAATKTTGKRIIVLGEMRELGDEAEGAYQKAGGAAVDTNPDALYLFGSGLQPAAQAAREAGFQGILEEYEEMEELKEALSHSLKEGDLILLKGSRGSALERLDEVISKIGTG
ncbi:MAG: UDP-N-acetylmuramoyl-tripeptide--D-alanyl-D-alanine ligase [Spirochaetales bacterium]|nr:UDP-N-acetylmuramoyl-tripeptide--D-alanyl-D-alanine ligase [Spirochaetales bacterium]